jgi:pimeloyl-ACP methyl ester carboxylesterase
MPSTDYLYRIQGLRISRREVLRYAFFAGVGLVAIPLIGCGGEEKEGKGTATALLPTVAPSGFFDSDGVKIHYETWGESKPIVLVHGYTVNLEFNWVDSNWVDTLQPLRRVVALDLRGHGESDKPHDPEAYSLENMGGDVLRLMDHLSIDKADLLGYSTGSGISSYLLARHGERFTSVILTAIGDRFVLGPTVEGRSNIMAEAMLTEDPSQITDPGGKAFRAIADAMPNSDLKALAALAQHPREPIDPADFAGVDIPVLIVSGANDNVMGRADELAAAIPGAKLVTIPDADHLVVFDPRTKEEVLAFLREH